MNAFKSFLLMLALTMLLVLVGQVIGGRMGMVYMLIMAGITNFISYWFSDKIVLMMYGARKVEDNELPELRRVVQNLTVTAGLPMPKLYVMETDMPNAFATGRNPQHAAVAVTTGILRILDEEELAGVVAHELSHIKNRDILVSTIAATIAGAIFMLARFAMFFGGGRDREENNGGALGMIVIAIIAPIAAMLIQMAISRSREYMADASGAQISGKPLALASALRKLVRGVEKNPVDASPTTAHMFIVSPLSGGSLLKIFSTHPPIEERVKRLEEMAQTAHTAKYNIPNVIS